MRGVLCGEVCWTGYDSIQGVYGIFANSKRGFVSFNLLFIDQYFLLTEYLHIEAFYIQVFHQKKVLVDEQQVKRHEPPL